eukprot:424876_1
MTQEFFVGQQLDVKGIGSRQSYQRLYYGWYIGTIIGEVDETEVIVKYNDDPHDGREVISKTSDRFAPLHSHTFNSRIVSRRSGDIYYESVTKNKYLISSNDQTISNYRVGNGGITLYNINKDKLIFIQYPRMLRLQFHATTLDTDNHILYLYGGIYNSFASYNFITKKWKVNVNSSAQNRVNAKKYNTFELVGVSNVYIPDPIGQIHIVTEEDHIKFDKHKKEFIDLPISFKIKPSKLVYIRSMKSLFAFPRTDSFYRYMDSKIIYCQITSADQEEYDWQEYELEMPSPGSLYNIVTGIDGFDYIVFIFYIDESKRPHNFDVYCMDLQHKKMFKSDKSSPSNGYDTYNQYESWIVKLEENLVRCYGLEWSLKEVITDEMSHFFQEHLFDALIFGFVRKTENEYTFWYNMPFYASKLILSYYQCF